jgi:hypothetical protein
MAATLLVATGCSLNEINVEQPPSPGISRQKTLDELKGRIISNSRSFATLTAKVDVALRSDFLLNPPQLNLSGKLALKRELGEDGVPRTKVYLYLERLGSKRIELIGDGRNYVVDMPVFGDKYSGEYGEPLSRQRNRIHFMPDDLASAFVITDLFYQSSQVLKSYPTRWDMIAGNPRNPLVVPPVWIIDSIRVGGGVEPRAWVDSSLVLDGNTEEVLRLDRFRTDGSLRTSIWYLNPGVIRGPDDESVRVPGEVLLWYPPPLESTAIRIRLREQRVNVPVSDDTFRIEG